VTAIGPLTAATRTGLPAPCVSCTFWQGLGNVTDERRKEAWSQEFGRRHGAFGLLLEAGGGGRAMMQLGPADAFPRAAALPTGPPARRAWLITCAYLEGVPEEDLHGVMERLLLEALADVKRRGAPLVDAFSIIHPSDAGDGERYAGHHTLFDRELLERLGFVPVRSAGRATLMRIDIGGLEPGVGLAGRALAAFRGAWPEARPSPA
jgi:hypothetical protein